MSIAIRYRDFIVQCLGQVLSFSAQEWLARAILEAEPEGEDIGFLRAVSEAPRVVGNCTLEALHSITPGGAGFGHGAVPDRLTADQAARIAILLGSSGGVIERRLDLIFRTGDLNERIAFYKGLALFPPSNRLVTFAMEGVRSSMTSLFEAVALDNPYPQAHFEQAVWNQMVVKALFVGSSIQRIIGLDSRANPELAEMLCDFASERWVGRRPVSPQLWRCVGPYAGDRAIGMLTRLLETGGTVERYAGALALSQCKSVRAKRLLEGLYDIRELISERCLTWDTLPAFTNVTQVA